jgi:hypothetical protein
VTEAEIASCLERAEELEAGLAGEPEELEGEYLVYREEAVKEENIFMQ